MTPQRRKRTAKTQKDREDAKAPLNVAQINELSNRIIGCAIKVHKTLGPGFIEKVYTKALAYEFKRHGIGAQQEVSFPVKYAERLVGTQRVDFVVEEAIIVETKAVYEINNFHMAQILSYLKATSMRLGLILNFSRARLQIKRVVHGL